MRDYELLRLSLHVTAATIWVGGQLVLAALVPVLRKASSELVSVAARAFARIAWPAFAVLLITGVWNVMATRDELHGARASVLIVKVAAVAASGVSAVVHQRTRSPRWRAVTGAGTAGFALTALVLGIQLTLP